MTKNNGQILNPSLQDNKNKSRGKAMTSHKTHEESGPVSQPTGAKNTIDFNRNRLNERLFSESF